MTTQGRSISSTIVDFFKRPLDRKSGVDDYNDLLSTHYGAEIAVEDHGSEISDVLEGEVPEHQGTLVLMDDEREYRPPIVSILPVERLRLLRQRQEWRRRIESGMLLTMAGPPSIKSDAPPVAQLHQPDILGADASRLFLETSNTPSPVKKTTKSANQEDDMSLRLRPLKKKRISETKRRGTKWSGDFEYDLAEYDHIPKQKIEKQGSIDDSGIDSPRLSIAKTVSKRSDFSQEGNSSELSALQRDILLKGPDSALTKKKAQDLKQLSKQEKDSSKVFSGDDGNNAKKIEKEKLILPSVGFDFIKSNDVATTGTTTDITSKLQTKPSFSFTANAKEEGTLKNSELNTTSNLQKAQKFSTAPAPSFNNKTNRSDDENDDEEGELKRKRPTFGGITSNIQPSFTFGKNSGEAESKKIPFNFGGSGDKKNGNSTPFTFTQKDSPIPATLDLINPKTEESKTKPSFSFGGGGLEKSDQKEKPSLFANKALNDTDAKEMPSFSFGKGNEKTTAPLHPGATTTTNSASNAPLSFGGNKSDNIINSKPSFNFGDKVEASSKPLLSFGAREDTASAAKPLFSFGKPNNNNLESKSGVSPAPESSTEKKDLKGPKLSCSFNPAKNSSPDSGEQASSNLSKPNVLIAAKESTSNGAGGSNINFNLPTTDQQKTQSEESTKSNTFSFSRVPGQPDASTKATPFSSGANGVGFSFGNDVKQPGLAAPKAQPSATGAFSFNRAGLPTINDNAASGPTTGANQSSFNFKLDSGTTKPVAPITNVPTLSGAGVANPFIGGASGFSFGSTNSNTNSNGLSSVFDNTNSLKPSIGGSTTPSPAFGQSATPPVPPSNPPSRTFTPSNTINLNFGSGAAGNPSSIFSGASQQANGAISGNSAAPQQIFGGTPPPSQIFGGVPQQPSLAFSNAQPTFGNMNNDTSQTQPGMQAPAASFQLPPGRKLARMRHSRRG